MHSDLPVSVPPPRARPLVRVVERFVLHGAPVDFRELCLRAVPADARYLVLDLDRTTHLSRNMGELLGWEICAWHGYGDAHLASIDARRTPGRFLFDPSRPAGLARYLGNSARMWIWPGLYYVLFGKLAAHVPAARREVYRAFGPEPVRAVQRVPQIALMHHMSELPLTTLRTLADRLFTRYAGDQIVDREDLAWLRQRCPDVRVILSSASPQPVVEAAAAALGADEAVYSDIERYQDTLAAPWRVDPRFMQRSPPRHIAPPGRLRLNAGHAKITELLRRHPEMALRNVVTVGITDNGYGEDQCWAEQFTRVIDVNTSWPFAPVVSTDSPVQQVHSASVLTRNERLARTRGDGGYLDPRRVRRTTASPRVFTGRDLERSLGAALSNLDALTRARDVAMQAVGESRDLLDARGADLLAAIEAVVARYNTSAGTAREGSLRELYDLVRSHGAFEADRARCLVGVSDVAFRIAQALEDVRRDFDAPDRPGVQPGVIAASA